ncbi:arrestin [Ilyonectria sp. MPI-CAGE-AT-0026]|nr:arrestin [Ilyonectria sp. MPI-CAGE-AT-0026]
MAIKAGDNWLGTRRDKGSPIEVKINDHFHSKVYYACGSPVSGFVVISTKRDVAFDVFEIIFTGKASTRVDTLRPCQSSASRTFIKMSIPIPRNGLPEPQVFKAARTYTIPFNFVVPSQLAPSACCHDCSAMVQKQHLRLPPTMGSWDGRDQAPEMVQVEYLIKAVVSKDKENSGQVKLFEGEHHICILPVSSEEPPLHITPEDKKYRLIQGKMMRQNLFSSRTGYLRAAAIQPNPIEFSLNALGARGSSIRIELEFVPIAGVSPPDIHAMAAKIHSTTHFSMTTINYLPNVGKPAENALCPVVTYSTANKINIDHPPRVVWDQQCSTSLRGYTRKLHLDQQERALESRIAEVCSGGNIPIKHVATLDIPFTLPTANKQIFLPTFHSCLISRTYSINLTLAAGTFGTAISLSIPLQVVVTDPSLTHTIPAYVCIKAFRIMKSTL